MITYSIERLYHFSCTLCFSWWSVGDWEIKEEMTCPHCGALQSIKHE